MSHVTHVNELHHAHERVTSHTWMSHATYIWVIHMSHVILHFSSRIWTSHVTHMDESCHIYMSHSHITCNTSQMMYVTYINESCHVSHTQMIHVPRIKELWEKYRETNLFCSPANKYVWQSHPTYELVLPVLHSLYEKDTGKWVFFCSHVLIRCYCTLRDMTHSYVWHDSYVVWYDSYVWHDSCICVKRLIHMCDMTHSYLWHDSFICVTWLINMCDMAHSYVWHDYAHVWHDLFYS